MKAIINISKKNLKDIQEYSVMYLTDEELQKIFDTAKPIMDPKEFNQKMLDIFSNDDPESAHANADALMTDLLRSLGYGKACDVFDDAMKWYA